MAEHQLNLDDLVRSVEARLRVSHGSQAFAVWPDGSVTEEAFGFRHREHQNGQLQVPLATFQSDKRMSQAFIRELITIGLRARGLLPPREPSDLA